jgi:branched-chain amino acid transport system substrate-binding protein
MTTKSKIILTLVIILAFVLVGYAFAKVSQENQSEKETIKIGVILPLSGGSANLGESAHKAILLAKEQLAETEFNYEVIFDDDAFDTKMTSNAVNKLVNLDQVDALISFSSGSGNVVSPIAQENKVIHVGVASDPNIAKGEYNFLHWTTPEAESVLWVEEVMNRGIKTFAFLGMNQQGLIAVLEQVKEDIKGKDIQMVNEQIFNMGEKDFKVIIEKAKRSNPDVIYIACFSPDLEIFAKQYKELGVDIPLTSIEAFEYTEQPELFEGYWYVQSAQASNEFLKTFEAKYDDNPQLGSPFIYDAFNLIVEAYEQTGEKDNAMAIEKLSQIEDFPSSVGTISVGEEGIVWSDASVREIRDGKPVTIN